MRSSDNQYWVALDHVRALAALVVFSWHFLHGVDGSPVPFEGAPILPPFAIFDEGHTGVAIFMCLSGYLFAKLLHSKKIDYSRFYYNRILRLAPLLVAVFILKFLKVAIFDFEMVGKFVSDIYLGFVFPTWPNGGWSITTELHFYILLPFLLFLTARDIRYLVLFVLAAIVLRAVIWHLNGSVQGAAYWTILGRIDQFLLGMLVFFRRDWIAGRSWLIFSILVGFYGFFWIFNAQGGFYQLGGDPSPSPLWIIIPTIEAITYSVLIAAYDRNAKSNLGWCSKIWADYGKFSYSIYLLHFFFVFRLADMLGNQFSLMSNFYVALIASFVSFLAMYPIGWMSYRFIEQPFLRHRLHYAGTQISQKATQV